MLIERHLHHLGLRSLSPNTIYARRRALIRFAAALPVPILEASRSDLETWRESISRLSPDGVSNLVTHIRQFYSWALEHDLIADNPASHLPVPRRPRRLPRPIPEEDLAGVLAAAPDRVRPWLILAGWAGLRAREIALLRRECVLERADPPSILVAADATKGRSERLVPMSDPVRAELAPILPAKGWVFRRADGQAGPNHPHTVSHLANEAIRTAGMPWTLHQLRHRFGTASYHVSHDLRLVQEMMGHRDPATTAGYADYDRVSAVRTVSQLPWPA